MPLWLTWWQIAAREAKLAAASRPPDAHIVMMSAKLAHIDHPEVDWVQPPAGELDSSMAAIVAAALAIDGFYGSLTKVIAGPAIKAPRARRILELLKLAFAVGKESQRWLADLSWLFDLRDRSVHHAEVPAPIVLLRSTEATDLLGARESYELSAPHAARAAEIARDVLATCLSKPTPATREWCERRKPAADVLMAH